MTVGHILWHFETPNGTREDREVIGARQGVTHPGFHCFGRNNSRGPWRCRLCKYGWCQGTQNV